MRNIDKVLFWVNFVVGNINLLFAWLFGGFYSYVVGVICICAAVGILYYGMRVKRK